MTDRITLPKFGLLLLAAFSMGCATTTAIKPAAIVPVVVPAVALTMAANSAPAGATVGIAYSATFMAGGGTPPYLWSTSAGAIPAGLSVKPADGTLSGTPTTTGSFAFQVVVTDSSTPAASASQSITLQIVPAPVTARAAARLLEQSSFGPTAAGIQHVQAVGMQAYLQEQFDTAATYLPSLGPGLDSDPAPNIICQSYSACGGANWWSTALFAPDQLRQRVAFALSEIFVVSDHGVDARGLPLYYNTLLRNAFAGYGNLMADITLNPAMGVYLSFIYNTSTPTTEANENYARELMQLFSLGLVRLNNDGTQALDSNGMTIPVYTQDQVRAFARAYTGWGWALADGSASGGYNPTVNYSFPLVPVEAMHDMTAKTLLGGQTLPAGQTVQQDLAGALANIFQDSNLAPYVVTKLIQNLVTATPGPAYTQRMVAVFNNDGTGVRGNLRAVVQAILLDAEARQGDTSPQSGEGHLKQPILWQSGALRGLGASPSTLQAYTALDALSNGLNQRIMDAPSVFGYYSPLSVLPQTTTTSPEFGLDTTALAGARLNVADQLINLGANGFLINLTPSGALFASMQQDPGACLDTLNTVLLHGSMPAAVRGIILQQIISLSDTAERLRLAVYLVITSNEFGSFD